MSKMKMKNESNVKEEVMKISKKILSLFLIITFFGLPAIPGEKAVAQTVIAGKKENIKSKKALRKHSETKIRIMVVSSYHKDPRQKKLIQVLLSYT